MIRIRLVPLMFLLLAAPAAAQTRSSPESRLQAAIHTELVEGDLDGALRLYRALAADRAARRDVVATALVNLGRTYEKLGNVQARTAYERVVREYADQSEAARLARTRLQSLSGSRTNGSNSTATSQVLVLSDMRLYQSERFRQFDLSPDGEQVALATFRTPEDSVEGRQIYITDRSGTLMRRLPSDGRRFRSMPRWSPDGRSIAYTAFEPRPAPDTGGLRVLMIAPADGGTPRRVTLDHPATARDIAWTPDGRHISLFRPRGMLTVDLDGRTVGEVADVRVHGGARTGGYSPDGRWIVLDMRATGSEASTDVWAVPAAGGRPIRLTERHGRDDMPAWAASGRAVYFVSDRSGSRNVWKVGFDPQTGQPQGEAQQVTFYEDADVRFPVARAGDRRIAFDLVPLNSAVHVAPVTRPQERRAVARGQYPMLSPDGREIYYVGEGSAADGMYAVATTGGAPRRITNLVPLPNYIAPFQVSPDGRELAFFTGDADSSTLYRVATADGRAVRLARIPRSEECATHWSPDGSQLAYTSGGQLFVIAAAGGAPRSIARLHQWESWTVRWSPDGRWIAALGYEERGQSNAVFVIPATGGERRRLTPLDENQYKEGLEWHPDGTRLTYMYYQGGGGDDTRVAYLDGRPTTLLVNQPAPLWDYIGTWTPDGRSYYFLSTPAGESAWGLYAFDEQSRTVSIASPATGGSSGLPRFSRDGALMTWTIKRDLHQLWMLETR